MCRHAALPYTLRRSGGILQGGACVQLARIEDGGSDAEQKLLIAVKAKNPDASPTELLRLFKADIAALIIAAEQGNGGRVAVAPQHC